jgi:hypothetical protein
MRAGLKPWWIRWQELTGVRVPDALRVNNRTVNAPRKKPRKPTSPSYAGRMYLSRYRSSSQTLSEQKAVEQ